MVHLSTASLIYKMLIPCLRGIQSSEFINALNTIVFSNQYHLRSCKLMPRMIRHKDDGNIKQGGNLSVTPL